MKRRSSFWKLFLILGILHWFFCERSYAQHKSVTNKSRAYFLNQEGDDKNDGSRAHPLKTLMAVNQLDLKPGDSILFRANQRFAGTLIIDSNKCGNAGDPLTLDSYGSGYATIQSGDSSAIAIYKGQFISIRNLHLIGAGRKTGNVRPGLAIVMSHHISIDRMDITGFQKAGLWIYSSSDIRVMHVDTHENGAAGIEVGGDNGKKGCSNLYIGYCRAEDNPGDPTNLTNHSGNGIVVGECSKVMIEYCSATNNGWDMPRIGNGPVGIWAYEADQVTIQHCLSYRNKTSPGAADGGGFDLDGGVTNSVVQYCLSYENQGAGYCIFQYYYASPWHDNIFRYNISENDGSVSDAGAGMYVWNSSRDENQFYNCLVYNNTIYNARVAALSYSELSKRKHFGFYNNIFVGKDSLVKGEKGNDIFQSNNWWSLAKGEKGKNAEHLKGLSVEPGFKKPGGSKLESVLGLSSFDQYQIRAKSVLFKEGFDLHNLTQSLGNKNDFNGKPSHDPGIGACLFIR